MSQSNKLISQAILVSFTGSLSTHSIIFAE